MFGCYDSYIVYGFKEGNRDTMVDLEWLYDNWSDITIYAIDIVRCHLGQASYGIACKIDSTTGVVSIGENDKKYIELFYKRVKEYKKENGEDNLSELGFFTALTGDYQTEQDTYILNVNDEGDNE